MRRNLKKAVFTAFILYLLFPKFVLAELIISEIMYDASGADTDREWVEIKNTGDDIDLTGYKFFDSANHVLNVPPKNGGRGSMIVTSGGFIILSSSPDVFMSEYGSYEGSVIDTSLVLGNTSGILKLINKEGVEVATGSYNKDLGSNGDGNSLHYDGSKYISSPPSPGQDFNGASSGSSVNNNTPSEGSTYQNTDGTSSTNTYKELLEIYADAGNDRVVMAGAETIFNAKGYGTDKTPLLKARYLWNFGDGSIGEGQMVSHSFIYPGDYAVIVYVSSGEYTANDKIVVKSIPSPISISSVNYFGDPYIKIKNDSTNDLDLSLWHIRAGDKYWSFPSGTFILKRNEITLSSKRTGLFPKEGESVVLLYPNGEKAFVWVNLTQEVLSMSDQNPKAPTSFQKKDLLNIPVKSHILEDPAVSGGFGSSTKENTDLLGANVLSSVSSFGGGLINWGMILFGICGLLITILFTFSKKPIDLETSGNNKIGSYRANGEEYKRDDDYVPDADEFEIMEDLL